MLIRDWIGGYDCEAEEMKLVYSYVCGDILHIGHIIQLANGKGLGDKLIVGVLTDKAIMEKKPRPIMSFERRLNLIRSLQVVDAAVPQNEYSPFKNVMMIQPDILMESESHTKYGYIKKLKKQFKGRIIFTPYYEGESSTKIKQSINRECK